MQQDLRFIPTYKPATQAKNLWFSSGTPHNADMAAHPPSLLQFIHYPNMYLIPYNNEMGGAYSAYWGDERCKLEGKRPLGRPRRRWEDNIKEVGCEDDRNRWWALVNAVMNVRVP